MVESDLQTPSSNYFFMVIDEMARELVMSDDMVIEKWVVVSTL